MTKGHNDTDYTEQTSDNSETVFDFLSPSSTSSEHHRTKRSTMPPHPYHTFQSKNEYCCPICKAFMVEFKGMFGVFYERGKSAHVPTLIEMNFTAFRSASYCVLFSILKHQTQLLATNIPSVDTVTEHCQHLANGVIVALYLKLHNINRYDPRDTGAYQKPPEIPSPFVIPLPYALAISQLQRIRISDSYPEIYLSPYAPNSVAKNFGCPAHIKWSVFAYRNAVAFAEKLGLRFCEVDSVAKMEGASSWWLYRPVESDGFFSLECPYPEENFTEYSALLASMFCISENDGFLNPIIDLHSLGELTYGTMLRNPPVGFALEVYNQWKPLAA